MKKLFLPLGIAVLFSLILAAPAHAAVVSVNTSSKSPNILQISLDTEGKTINAVDMHFTFDPSLFTVKEINDGGSVVNLWVTEPSYSNESGRVDLSGIIPGGISTISGSIISITIVPKNSVIANLTLATGTLLLNDGKGTSIPFTFRANPIQLALINASTSMNLETTDSIGPDPFIPVIASYPDLFDQDYFLVFAATDVGSGIDHYEVLETAASGTIGNVANWVRAKSPYELKDQTLSSDIYVRAVDHAGNFRMVEISASEAEAAHKDIPASGYSPLSVILVVGIILICIAAWWKFKRKTKQ